MAHQKLPSNVSSTSSHLHSFGYSTYHMEKKHQSNFHNQRSMKRLKCKEEFHKRELDGDNHNHIEEQLVAIQEENNNKKIRGESKKRRQAIFEKYKHIKLHQLHTKVDKAENRDDEDKTLANNVKMEDISNENSIQKSASMSNLFEQKSQKGNQKHSSDMFCNDMFTKSPLGGWKVQNTKSLAIKSSRLQDNWDDVEGRYRFHLNELLDGRYHILKSLGSGVFSTVIKAHDTKASENDPKEVAIKIIRNNKIMYKSGLNEVVVLKTLAKQDANNRKHCVQLFSSFEYRNHLCLVFESLHMNLRQVLNKYGRNIGINLEGVQTYARQIFIALQHLQDCGILHCDIKLDNILVSDSIDVRKSRLRLCDFGSSMFVAENEITPYLVSQYYRAPEIILGLPYNHALDIWSVACCLCELYTGEVLFPGHNNNEMLQLHMKLMGAFPKKMLKRALFQKSHFDHDLNFCAIKEDLVTRKMMKKIIKNNCFAKVNGIRPLLMNLKKGSKNLQLLDQFIDLLTKMLTLDPSKRMTAIEALNHPFILK